MYQMLSGWNSVGAIRFAGAVLCLFAFGVSQAVAQSTPSEFAELTLHQLQRQTIHEGKGSDGSVLASPWALIYEYRLSEFEGYLDGDRALSFQDVLWNGPGEQRTDKNFPVVPTVIRQSAHIMGLEYKFNSYWRGHVYLPYVAQETDHISIVRDYGFFILETSGLGDVALTASYALDTPRGDSWVFSGGISLPTGSIDEEGDTPRAPGNQQLPYTMQLGSGTYDFPLELSYRPGASGNLVFGLSANLRTGRNERNYRLGNNYAASVRYEVDISPNIQATAGLHLGYSGSILGRDSSLMVEAPFPYPASITNPGLYGGQKLRAQFGLAWRVTDRLQLNMETGVPVHQELNGPQPKERWRSSIQFLRAW